LDPSKKRRLCAVNTADMSSDKDFSRECVGPSEVIYLGGQSKKHCERVIERESIYCPVSGFHKN